MRIEKPGEQYIELGEVGWIDPTTGRVAWPPHPDTGLVTVAIAAMAKTTRNDVPWDDPYTLILAMNESYVATFEPFPPREVTDDDPKYYLRRWDALFQLHRREDFSRLNNHNDPNHFEWLRRQPGRGEPDFRPIFMQTSYQDIPASIEYPLAFIHKDLGLERELSCTIAHMIAWAIWSGFTHIQTYGMELSSATEYGDQRTGVAYWIGVAEAMGIRVDVHAKGNFLKTPVYGYATATHVNRQMLEFYQRDLAKRRAQAEYKMLSTRGQLEALDAEIAELQKNRASDKAIQRRFQRKQQLMQEYEHAFGQTNANAGAEQMMKQLIAHCDARLPTPEKLEELLRLEKIEEQKVQDLDSGLDNVTIDVEVVDGQ